MAHPNTGNDTPGFTQLQPVLPRPRNPTTPGDLPRLMVIAAGYPPPQTQIPVYGGYGELVAVVDLGWEDLKIALEYEGDHHRTDRRQLRRDIERYEALDTMGWITIRVTADHTRGGILARLAAAWTRRT